MMRQIVLVAAALVALAGCASNDGGGAVTPAPAAEAPPAAAPGATVAVTSAQTDLGQILAGPDGRTLYGFTNDVKGQSTCFGTCAEAWPPVLVGADWTVGPELDSGVFSTVDRGDGTKQLVAGKWPLYYYASDTAPGDTTGQASGNVWFVVGTDAALIRDAAVNGAGDESGQPTDISVDVQLGETQLGEVLVDSEGLSLYAFTNDADGNPTCAADCADAWPAAIVDGEIAVAEELDSAVFSVVPALDGGEQLKAGKWPLYRFAGDAAPGDINGQGSGGVWFLVAADGSLVGAEDAGAATGDSAGGGQ